MEALAGLLTPQLAPLGLQVVYTEANRGKSTAWYVAQEKFAAIVGQYRPGVLLVELGTNDQPNAAYEATLRAAVAQVRSAGSPEIYWFGPSFSTAALEARLENVKVHQQATLPALGVHWFDSQPMTQHGHGPDGVHFTRTGYRSWSSSMAQEMKVAPSSSSMLPFVALTLTAVVVGVLLFSRFTR